MRRKSKGTDSYKRKKPADEAVRGINTSGKVTKDTVAAAKAARNTDTTNKTAGETDAVDKSVRDTDTTDKAAKVWHTSDKSVALKDSVNNGIGIEDTDVKDTPAETGSGYSPETHTRDANSHTIFRNRKLTCQFLRDYIGLPIFENLQPEDIEDVTERYQAFLGVPFEADAVKKVRIRSQEGESEVFVLPLVEHKTDVDYDVAMQLLRYMMVIWYDYKKQQEGLKKGSTSRKGFRYPPIIPIVYYEGQKNWTADLHLSDRINVQDGLEEYIPDFVYKLVRVHGYGNDDLKKRRNEMSLVMMINRIQSPEDFTELINTSRDYVDEIYNDSTADIKAVYQDILWALLQKMNVPVEEAREKMAGLEDNGMGKLFASMEKMDIQAERRNTQLARREAETAKRDAEFAKQDTEAAKRDAEAAKKKLEEVNRRLERLEESDLRLNTIFGQLVSICRDRKMSREETLMCLQEQYGLSETEAASAVEQFWQRK